MSPSTRRETDHPHSLRDGTFQRVRTVHQLGFRLAVVCSLFLAFAAGSFASDAANVVCQRKRCQRPCSPSVQRHSRWASCVDGSVRIVTHAHICNVLAGLHLANSSTLFEVEGFGESSISVPFVVLKFLPVCCESVILKAFDCGHFDCKSFCDRCN